MDNAVKLLVMMLIALMVSCVRPDPLAGPENTAARLLARSSTIAEFSSGMFSEGLFNGSVSSERGVITVTVDILETADIKQMYLEYCNTRGGDLIKRYVPDGFAPTIGHGFQSQPVFFHKSRIGRTEFEFCTTNWNVTSQSPLFAITPTGRDSFYLLEGDALARYVDAQEEMVVSFADEAKKTLAFYISERESTIGGVTLVQASLMLYTAKPLIMATFKNISAKEAIIPLNAVAVLLIDHNQYYMAPAYAGGDRYDNALQKGACTLSKDNSAMLLPVGATCNVMVALKSETDIKKLPAARASVFFAGYAITMLPQSEYDTNDSTVWLKPRLEAAGFR